jgi:hypothetical protein
MVAAGDTEITLGGHFLEGAWSLILLHDHHHGHDFAEDLGEDIQTRLEPITAADAGAYLEILTDPDWRAVDFKQFSKVHNPELTTYRWPLNAVFEQLRESQRD